MASLSHFPTQTPLDLAEAAGFCFPPLNEAKTVRLGMLQESEKKTHQAGSDKGALISCTRYKMPNRNGGKE